MTVVFTQPPRVRNTSPFVLASDNGGAVESVPDGKASSEGGLDTICDIDDWPVEQGGCRHSVRPHRARRVHGGQIPQDA
jgi:hypothetical protein